MRNIQKNEAYYERLLIINRGFAIKPKGRPRKKRIVEKAPTTVVFSPRGRPGRPDEVELKFEGLEALRLADFMGMKHAEAAIYMEVSRQTFGRVLNESRRAVADALVNGKIIKVTGGIYRIAKR